MDRIFGRPQEDDSRAAFALTVGVPPPPAGQARSPVANDYSNTGDPDGIGDGEAATRRFFPPSADSLAAGDSLDEQAPSKRPFTQDALDQLRRSMEAARIEETRLNSLLGAAVLTLHSRRPLSFLARRSPSTRTRSNPL